MKRTKRDSSKQVTLGETTVRLGEGLHHDVKELAKQCNVSFSQMSNILMYIGYMHMKPLVNPPDESIKITYYDILNKWGEIYDETISDVKN